MVVILALMTHRQHGDGDVVFDVEQRNVAAGAEADDQFAQERIVRPGLAAAERRELQHRDAIADGLQRSFGVSEIAVGMLQKEFVETIEVVARFFREADRERHPLAFRALCRRVSNPDNTMSAGT